MLHAIGARPGSLTPSTHPKLGVKSRHQGLHRCALQRIFRPSLGWMLGVKDSGRAPMAWSIRPGFRGDLNLVRRRSEPLRQDPDRVRIRYEPARRCTESCAACSVACLEVNMRGRKNSCSRSVATECFRIASGNHACKRG